VSVKARDLNGKEFRIRNATGLLAQAIEHETDHLSGTLYIDHLASLEELYKISTHDEEEEEDAEGGDETEGREEPNVDEAASAVGASPERPRTRPGGVRRARARS
jgi:hypothetical protein